MKADLVFSVWHSILRVQIFVKPIVDHLIEAWNLELLLFLLPTLDKLYTSHPIYYVLIRLSHLVNILNQLHISEVIKVSVFFCYLENASDHVMLL